MAQTTTDSTHEGLLARWGRNVARHRRAVVIVPILLVLALLPLLGTVQDRLSSGGWLPAGAESVAVDHRLDAEFGRHATAHYILFSDPTGQLAATDPAFQHEAERALAPLRGEDYVTAIYTWGNTTGSLQSLLIADDGRQGLAIVMVDQDIKEAAAEIPRLRGLLQSDVLEIQIGGWPATTHDFRDLTASDLERAEAISLPLTLLVLALVFGGFLVAGVPLLTSILALIPALAVIALVSRVIETSVFTVNIVIMVGLAVGIDYALIFVSRYREELRTHEREDALAITMATAGRTVVASGATVAIGMLGLLTFGVPAATATGIAASAVVVFGVAVSLSVLPALLALLGDRARGRAPRTSRLSQSIASRTRRALGAIRAALDRHPGLALAISVLVLLVMAAPVLGMRPEPPGMTVLPQSQPARQMYDAVQAGFSTSTLSPMTIIVEPRNDRPMTNARNLNDLAAFAEQLAAIDGVDSVVSVWSFVPANVGAPFLSGAIRVDPDLAAVAQPYLTDTAAVIEVNVHAGADSEQARSILDQVRNETPRLSDGRFSVTVGGETATSVDLVNHLAQRAPWTIGFVLLATAIVLGVQFHSLLLPIKAILLNMLSLTASFGALVWVFQEGRLSGLLGFEPLGYTVVIVPVLMFCFMFGLSMDYEVIMLSRIREAWLDTGNNRTAVSVGLRGSARIVTSAALVMLIVFAAFGASELQVIKQIGLGLALAVFVDATVIRLVALPAAMQLMGRWNWWMPRWTHHTNRPGPAPSDATVEPL